MLVKRKRSDSELSCSSTSTLSSPPRSRSLFHKTPAHLNSRTLKRHRDNRPSEDQVYERTLHLLYSAQQPHVHSPISCTSNSHAQPEVTQARANSAQPSLHTFWTLPGADHALPTRLSGSSHAAMTSAPSGLSLTCAECGLDTPTDNLMDDGMHVDADTTLVGGSATGHGPCSYCDKAVCQQCSITNLDEQRVCLSCTKMLQKNHAQLPSRMSFFTRQ